jgi:transcriptional regulator with XRE-family HTH domain
MATGAVDGFDGDDARTARERLGMTQFQVAVELGVTPQHISNFERGRHQLSPRLRWQLAELLGLSHGDLQPAPESRLEVLQTEMSDIKRQLSELTVLVEELLAASQRAAAKRPASPSRR